MNQKTKMLSFLIGILALALFVSFPSSKADLVTSGVTSLPFIQAGTVFNVETADLFLITFDSNQISGSGFLQQSDNSGGLLTITPVTSGNLVFASNDPHISFQVNGAPVSSPVSFSSGEQKTVTWSFSSIYGGGDNGGVGGGNPTPGPSSKPYDFVGGFLSHFSGAINKIVAFLKNIPPWAIWVLIGILVFAGVIGIFRGNKSHEVNPSRSFNNNNGEM